MEEDKLLSERYIFRWICKNYKRHNWRSSEIVRLFVLHYKEENGNQDK